MSISVHNQKRLSIEFSGAVNSLFLVRIKEITDQKKLRTPTFFTQGCSLKPVKGVLNDLYIFVSFSVNDVARFRCPIWSGIYLLTCVKF